MFDKIYVYIKYIYIFKKIERAMFETTSFTQYE